MRAALLTVSLISPLAGAARADELAAFTELAAAAGLPQLPVPADIVRGDPYELYKAVLSLFAPTLKDAAPAEDGSARKLQLEGVDEAGGRCVVILDLRAPAPAQGEYGLSPGEQVLSLVVYRPPRSGAAAATFAGGAVFWPAPLRRRGGAAAGLLLMQPTGTLIGRNGSWIGHEEQMAGASRRTNLFFRNRQFSDIRQQLKGYEYEADGRQAYKERSLDCLGLKTAPPGAGL